MRRIRPLAVLVTVVAALVVAPASASEKPACTSGDAQGLSESFYAAVGQFRRGHDHPGIVESVRRCQYRLFWDGQTFTFHESDHFVGGIVWFWDYKASGISRADAIADFELIEDRVWLAAKLPGGGLGPFVEQTLERTAYKSINDPVFGQIVWQHRAFIAQLPAGEYVSYWVSTYPGLPDESATVNLVILPG